MKKVSSYSRAIWATQRKSLTWAQAQPAWPSNTPSSIPRVCRHVAALRRSSMGALAGSWLLSKPRTDDTFFPSNSGTWNPHTRESHIKTTNITNAKCLPWGGTTDLKAVLIGFQNGIDLRRSEVVAAQHWGRLVASWWLLFFQDGGRLSWGATVSGGKKKGLVVLTWHQTGGKDLGTGQTPEQLRCNRHCLRCTAGIHKQTTLNVDTLTGEKPNTSKAPSYGNPESKVHTPQRNKVSSACTVKQTLCKQTEICWWDFGSRERLNTCNWPSLAQKIQQNKYSLTASSIIICHLQPVFLNDPFCIFKLGQIKQRYFTGYWPIDCHIKKNLCALS